MTRFDIALASPLPAPFPSLHTTTTVDGGRVEVFLISRCYEGRGGRVQTDRFTAILAVREVHRSNRVVL